MHAYLFVGQGIDSFQLSISSLATKLNAKILEYPLQKIDDVRSLNDLINLSFNEPTLIVCKNIEGAGEEALNAFLKNLEEPQENIFFALTAPSTRKVLPTIVSRCEIVKVINNLQFTIYNEDTEKFIKAKTCERLAIIDKIKDRARAIELIENLINFLHNELHSNGVDYQKTAKNIETASQTLKNLRANGNVSLQLTNLVVSLV